MATIITGQQSIERIQPLLCLLQTDFDLYDAKSNPIFVWETTCSKKMRSFHNSAEIINKLNNTQIIENKGELAYLQLRMKKKTLTTFLALNAREVEHWTNIVFGDYNKLNLDNLSIADNDWWAVKASKGNGGRDVWIINKKNYKEIITQIPANDEYVIQRFL
jgi:hypothetical protein